MGRRKDFMAAKSLLLKPTVDFTVKCPADYSILNGRIRTIFYYEGLDLHNDESDTGTAPIACM